eukprot:1142376-Pelagomonas_calceolata.AAC.4
MWDSAQRVHKDSIRAAMVSGRGASTIGKNPVRNSAGDILRDFYSLLQESLFAAGIHTNKGRAISAFAEGLKTEAKVIMVPIGVHPIHRWVETFEGNVTDQRSIIPAPESGNTKDVMGKIHVHVFRRCIRWVNGMCISDRESAPLM